MPTEIYNAGSYYFYITSYDLITFAIGGVIDGDYFALTYDNTAVTAVEGAQGDVQYSVRVAGLATLTIALEWGSESNKILNRLYNDQNNGNNIVSAELKKITQTSNESIMTCSRAMIEKRSDYTIGAAAADRTWTLKLEKTVLSQTQDPV